MKKIVCIMPGHGGKDSGAVGPSGLRESDVVLPVSLFMRTFLERAGVTVVMTREEDVFVGLTEQARIANRAKADLAVSVHCNSAENPAWGIETFIARRTSVSYPLAESIQDALTSEFPDTPDRGVKRANFTVLTGTKMAAALAELEFIHTPCGEDILRSVENQRRYGDSRRVF